jgi:hypothetical protein
MAEEIFASLPREQLLLVQRVHADGLTALENKMRSIVEKGAREGKTISLEKALKPVIDQRDSYIGADRDEVVADLDRLINGLRERYGPEIPADEAHKLMRELEGRARGDD